ncbi:hypothetical protein [Okeania sp. KiyG1]|nr:hypothetical protein [Okeania sp. KiyG1]
MIQVQKHSVKISPPLRDRQFLYPHYELQRIVGRSTLEQLLYHPV